MNPAPPESRITRSFRACRFAVLLALAGAAGIHPIDAAADAPKAQPAVRFGQEGIDIDAGSLGKFTIAYPALLDGKQQPQHKLVEKKADPNTANLKYEGGAQLDLTFADGKLAMKFAQVPADVKFVAFDMHIPIAFNQGGSWVIGDKQGEFPKEKPATPHLFQGHGAGFKLTNFEGKALEFKVPEFAWLQLTDNREWNWAIYHWRAVVPFDPNRKDLNFTITGSGGTGKTPPLVDELGQAAREEWPGKVKSLEELKADVEAEKASPGRTSQLDPMGGLSGSKEKLGLKATGFFHVEKKGERWLLVDPAGNAFFHLGLCSIGPNEDYTLVKGRESAFAWLPPREGEFGSAWKKDSGGTVVSFHLANMIRKYGQPYTNESYTARMITRVRQWGFNSGGAFSNLDQTAREAAQFPYVAHLPLSPWEGIPRIEGIHEVFDPFDEKTRAKIEENMAKSLPSRASDPLIIGYFIVNEPIYENIPHIVPSLKGTSHACKRRLVQWLEEKYKTVDALDAAWVIKAKSFAELSDMVVPVESKSAKADVQKFTGLFLDEYFRLVAESFRRHDPNHLLIGSRLMPGTINNEQLCRIAGKYLDVMSFNYYTNAVDQELLRHVYQWTGGRPIILSEFYWSASKESGLSGGREVGTQRERGLAYRNYVEQSAALGFVVGIEWFTLVDQAVTGRSFQGFDGERANTGILAVTDRPWKAMLDEATKTNFDIYKVWLGERQPFAFDDPRFKGGK
ncbi:MAG: hypothetical protein QOE70_2678 [Chthoniobacter sp.]|jgi:hypothetical protein|nr:hypothetical protein [Chthoniobacter sp.]